MSILDINDGEYANFMQEMQEDERNMRKRRETSLHAIIHNLPHEVSIDLPTLRRLLQRHNQAIAMLREFLEMHPEKSDLTQRARKLMGSPK